MPRVSLEAFLQGMTAAATGQIAGHLAGQQQADARDQQQFSQALQFAQLGQQQQEQQNRLLTSQLPNLTPESQAQALTNMGSQPSPFAPLATHPFIQKHPEYQPFFAAQPPAAAPAGASGGFMGAAAGQKIPQAPAAPAVGGPGQPTFNVGGQNYALKGVNAKEATRLVTGMDKALGEMRSIKLTDPRSIAARDEYFRARTALGQLDTPEKMQAANQLYQNILNFQSSVGGPVVQAAERADLRTDQEYHRKSVDDAITKLDDRALAGELPDLLKQEMSLDKRRGERGGAATGIGSHKRDISEIEFMLGEGLDQDAAKLAGEVRRSWKSKLTPQQSLSAQKSAMQFLGQYSARQITPDLVRHAFKDAPGLIEGMTDAELRGYGSKALEGEWQKSLGILSNPKRWASLPKPARKAILDEISGTAALTGRNIELPADMVLELTEEEKRKLAQRDTQLRFTGIKINQAKAKIDLDRAQFQFAKEKFGWEKQQAKGKGGPGGKGSVLTQNSKAKQLHDDWTEAKDDFDGALKGAKMSLAEFDPEHPDTRDPYQKRLGELYQRVQNRRNALKGFLLKQGLDLDAGTDVAPTAGGNLPTGKRSTSDLLKRLGEIAAEEEAKKAKG